MQRPLNQTAGLASFLSRLRIGCLANFKFPYDERFSDGPFGGKAPPCSRPHFYVGCGPFRSGFGFGISAEVGSGEVRQFVVPDMKRISFCLAQALRFGITA
jgi:hypothetical protein